MLRLLICTAALTLAVSSVSQVIAATPRYTMTQLRAVATAVGTYASVNDINNNGLAVGVETRLATGSLPSMVLSATRGFSWSADAAGTPTPLANPPGPFVGAAAERVNDAGQIVGVAYYSSGGRVAAALGASTSAAILPLTDIGSIAGLNGAGDVFATGINGPVLLRGGTATQMNVTGYGGAVDAVGITDGGLYIGQHRTFSTATPRPLRLSPTAAPVPLVTVNSVALAVNNSAIVAGYVVDAAGSFEAATFSGGTARRIGKLPYAGTAGQNGSGATGINDRGDVVGISGPSTGSAAEQKSFLFRDGSLIDLATLIDGGTLPSGFRPNGINDRGQIIGNVYVDHDNNTATARIGLAYRLDPIRVAGDATGDGRVDVADLGILATSYGSAGRAFYETGDFNYDWRVDVADLGILATHYGTPHTLAADLAAFGLKAVPEPASVWVLAAAGALLARRRRAAGYSRP